MPLRLLTFSAAISLSLCGCAQFPDLDAAISDQARRADYPALVPAEELTARVDEPRIDENAADTLSARVARLRARAQSLRGSVLDSPTRARLQTDIAEN